MTYYLVFAVGAIVFLVLLRVVNSPFGRVLQAIRENPFRAEALGYRIVFHRTLATCISALGATLAGALFALWLRYVGPDTALSFSIQVDVLVMVVVGGMGSLYGAIIGAALFVFAESYLQVVMAGLSQAAANASLRSCRRYFIPTAGCFGWGSPSCSRSISRRAESSGRSKPMRRSRTDGMDRDGCRTKVGRGIPCLLPRRRKKGPASSRAPTILNGLTAGLQKWDGASLDEAATFVLFMFSEFGTFLYRVPAMAIYSALEDPSRTSGHVAPRPASQVKLGAKSMNSVHCMTASSYAALKERRRRKAASLFRTRPGKNRRKARSSRSDRGPATRAASWSHSNSTRATGVLFGNGPAPRSRSTGRMLDPGASIGRFAAGAQFDNPMGERLMEGLRKAGVPEA